MRWPKIFHIVLLSLIIDTFHSIVHCHLSCHLSYHLSCHLSFHHRYVPFHCSLSSLMSSLMSSSIRSIPLFIVISHVISHVIIDTFHSIVHCHLFTQFTSVSTINDHLHQCINVVYVGAIIMRRHLYTHVVYVKHCFICLQHEPHLSMPVIGVSLFK